MNRTGRRPRTHKLNTIYHVMMRGNNRQTIFFHEDYFQRFLHLIDESTKKFDHKILAYCLMTNHIHLIIHVHESPLSDIMQNINFRYARWTNHTLKRVGHLFQARYCSLEVANEAYLINLCRYIHYNPVAAKMVKNPIDYRWSSHKEYVLRKNPPEWLQFETVICAIKNKTRLNYLDFMEQELDRKTWKPAFYFSEKNDLIINDSIMKTTNKIRKVANSLPEKVITEIVSKNLVTNQVELYGFNKNHEMSKKRILLISYLIKYSGMKLPGIANLFQRSTGTLYRQLAEFNHVSDHYFSNDFLKKIDDEIQMKLLIFNKISLWFKL